MMTLIERVKLAYELEAEEGRRLVVEHQQERAEQSKKRLVADLKNIGIDCKPSEIYIIATARNTDAAVDIEGFTFTYRTSQHSSSRREYRSLVAIRDGKCSFVSKLSDVARLFDREPTEWDDVIIGDEPWWSRQPEEPDTADIDAKVRHALFETLTEMARTVRG